jgi:phage N-6-adenine-methyltransferase
MSKNHLEGSGKQNWFTPEHILDAARKTIGKDFDLDPSSSIEANNIVKAKRFIDIDEDALNKNTKWRQNSLPIGIWMNPPYSRGIMGKFVDRLLSEITMKDQAIVIVNSDTGSKWYQKLLENSTGICHVKGRVSFIDGDTMEIKKGNNYSQTIFYFGLNFHRFFEEFSKYGIISNHFKNEPEPTHIEDDDYYYEFYNNIFKIL